MNQGGEIYYVTVAGRPAQILSNLSETEQQRVNLVKKEGISKMAILDPTEWDLENAPEPQALFDGWTGKLRIIEVSNWKQGGGLSIRMEALDEPLSKDIFQPLGLPDRVNQDIKRFNQSRSNLKMFMQCFGIDMTIPSNPEQDWPNQEGSVILGQKKDDKYGTTNIIKEYLRS